jgi:dolichol kinase
VDITVITALLVVWNLAVIHYISKWFYDYFKKYKGVPADYVGRKIVHIFGGGVTALLAPMFFEGYYWIVTISAFLLAGYVYFRRRWKLMYWFQVKQNAYEVHFSVAYGLILIVGLLLGDVWAGLVPMLFMSFGDSATGLVRAFTQRRQVKSWDGTVAMFIVCSIIGFWRFSWYGVFLGGGASIVEKTPGIDDNVTVPVVTVILVYLKNFLPI